MKASLFVLEDQSTWAPLAEQFAAGPASIGSRLKATDQSREVGGIKARNLYPMQYTGFVSIVVTSGVAHYDGGVEQV